MKIKCGVCGGFHIKGSRPYNACHTGQSFADAVTKNHRFHTEANGPHPHCRMCAEQALPPLQLQLFDPPREVIDICGCQG